MKSCLPCPCPARVRGRLPWKSNSAAGFFALNGSLTEGTQGTQRTRGTREHRRNTRTPRNTQLNVMEISAKLVKELRDRTGAGMMECKKALVAANGSVPEAEIILRKSGIARASGKAARTTRQGRVGSYIHAGAQLGVLIEVNCESDFVAHTDDFQSLVRDLAMQVAAADPQFIRKEDVTPEVLEKKRDIQRRRALQGGHAEKMAHKILEA